MNCIGYGSTMQAFTEIIMKETSPQLIGISKKYIILSKKKKPQKYYQIIKFLNKLGTNYIPNIVKYSINYTKKLVPWTKKYWLRFVPKKN